MNDALLIIVNKQKQTLQASLQEMLFVDFSFTCKRVKKLRKYSFASVRLRPILMTAAITNYPLPITNDQ
jgi:hypothetical protein